MMHGQNHIKLTSTVFIDHMPTHLSFKKVCFMLASEFTTVYHVV